MPGQDSTAGLALQPLHDTLHSSFPGQEMSPFIHTASFKVCVLCPHTYTCPHAPPQGTLGQRNLA